MYTTDREFAEHIVDETIAWLDENEPEWRSKVSVETLDIWSSNCCVAGQIWGDKVDPGKFRWSGYDYYYGKVESGEWPRMAFYAQGDELFADDCNFWASSDLLTEVWKEKLSA